ncbi:endonuclease III [Liquorilactobacillus capillatus]|uniref:Endonuclease III n=1 Tax=Liquorilactobacillus capillatus DSM 19910 TaxID=1423731 RepID=A0A0R1M6M4_9LACO|nr:endonuclease III [Liquorilactobacillus capillatus]KRL00059.1 endonuclease III [Liquorilactobacillus capillatus DSM 19910]
MLSGKDTVKAITIMSEKFPEARTSLEADTDFHFLLAVILSAQTTDKAVNLLTPRLFDTYPTPATLAVAEIEDVIPLVHSIGLYRNKGKYIIACAKDIVHKFGGQVPRTRQELMQLAGVGRKTADVVLAERFNIPAIAVDTHVTRVSKRLRIVPQKADVLTIEKTLMKKLPKDLWIKAHHCMIFWGRYQCTARNPHCADCPLLSMCAEGQKRVK